MSLHDFTCHSFNCLFILLSICLPIGFYIFSSIHTSVCLSTNLTFYLCPSVCLFVRPSLHLSACLSVCQAILPSVRLSVCFCLSGHPSLFPTVRLSSHPSICPPVCLFVRPTFHLSACLSVRPFIYPSVFTLFSLCLSFSRVDIIVSERRHPAEKKMSTLLRSPIRSAIHPNLNLIKLDLFTNTGTNNKLACLPLTNLSHLRVRL